MPTFNSMPWQWFDLEEPSRPLPENPPSLDNGGWRNVYRTHVDGREIPFKLFTQQGLRSRPTVILLHGLGLHIASFHGVAPYLFRTHDLVLLDYSSLTLPVSAGLHEPTMKHFVTAILRVADLLRLERFSLAGNSLGGGLCLLVALAAPTRVDRMCLANPACFPQTLPRTYRIARFPLVGEFFMSITPPEKFVGGIEYIGYVNKDRFEPQLRRRYSDQLIPRTTRLRLMGLMRSLPAGARDLTAAPHIPRLGELHQPVLITWGEEDPLLVEGSGERLARALPHGTFDPHPDLAHMPHEEAPERIGPIWSAFLNAT